MKHLWQGLIGGVLLPLGVWWPGAAQAAQTILFNFGPLEFTIAVASLEAYAATGRIAPDFRDVASRLNAEQLADLRFLLTQRADLDPVTVSQFLYSPQGEVMLRQLGELIQTRQRVSGFYALRSALILAAADQQTGLTALNVLDKFPVDGLRINSALAFEMVNLVSRQIEATERAIAIVEAAANGINEEEIDLPYDLRIPGPLTHQKRTIRWRDEARQRNLVVDLYLPEENLRGDAPVLVISHGLGSNRQTFAYLAEHLVSYGFAVVVPEHPGSNAAQLMALATGLAREITPPQELVDRPLDIQFILDQLEGEYGDRLNLQRVGIVGQSFGAYTALALAGAEINGSGLDQVCPNALFALNLSLVLQCGALRISAVPPLRDERIQAVIAINPLMSQIFAPAQLGELEIPVMIVTASADTVTPALEEQIIPFTTLKMSDRYLVLLQRGTHFSTLGATDDDADLPPAVLGPDPQIAQAYTRSLSLAFFGAYIANQPDYQNYLGPRYLNQISQTAMPITVVRQLDASQLRRR
ncbi:alpha/beta fold hydrolase [Spirulina sp. CCNP1310]|uniref:alpha/beta hydrolase n=1 Tax=Spirulina sp. CCNP1310 TaxID=3110249 RepID=UPI002B1F38B9|nr:alpha/beta fold hydrolase [Spirulina sp. CCNP1310]MEA5419011.1 alpha/beta fold hydrolase [Spirulina sp. CCNP1310]